jgi:hypothetical protein
MKRRDQKKNTRTTFSSSEIFSRPFHPPEENKKGWRGINNFLFSSSSLTGHLITSPHDGVGIYDHIHHSWKEEQPSSPAGEKEADQ